MQLVRRSDLAVALTFAVFVGIAAAILASRVGATAWLGLAAAAAVVGYALRRPLRRWRATRAPLSARATRWLEAFVPFYRGLPEEARRRFRRDVQIALTEFRFEGVAGVVVTDELKLAVAAGAALLLHGRPEWELPFRHTVLFFPEAFDEEYEPDEDGSLDGLMNHQGPLLLSAPAVEYGWRHADGQNVVLHELAHLLDFQDSPDGLPSLLAPSSAEAWSALVRRERRKIRTGRSVLRAYAATNSAELFAVGVEQFFERPLRLRARHPELFRAFVSMFNLDPSEFAEENERTDDALIQAS